MRALSPKKSATQEQVVALDQANQTLRKFNMSIITAYFSESLIAFINGYLHAPTGSFVKNDGPLKTVSLLLINLLVISSQWFSHDAFQPNLSSEQANKSLKLAKRINDWRDFIILLRFFISYTLCPTSWNDIVTSCTEKGCSTQASTMQLTLPFVGALMISFVSTAFANANKKSQKERENNNKDLCQTLGEAITNKKIHIAETPTKRFRKLELNRFLKITADEIGITLRFTAPGGEEDLPCTALARIAVDFFAATLAPGSQILYEDSSGTILLRMSDKRFACPKQINLTPLLEQFDRFFIVLAYLEPAIAQNFVKLLVLDGELLYLIPNNGSEILQLRWNEDSVQQSIREKMKSIYQAKKSGNCPIQDANLPLAPRPPIQTQAHYEQISNIGPAKPRQAKSDGAQRLFASKAAQERRENAIQRDFGDYGLYTPDNPLADNDATVIRRIDMDDRREIYVKAAKNDSELLAEFRNLGLAQRRVGNKGLILTLAPENSLSDGSPVLAKIKKQENESFVATRAVQISLGDDGHKATLLIFDGRTMKHNHPPKWPKNKNPGIIEIESKRHPAASF